MSVAFNEERTAQLVDWTLSIWKDNEDKFEASKIITKRLGAHQNGAITELGFWTPELRHDDVDTKTIGLEIFTPVVNFDLSKSDQQVEFVRKTVTPKFAGEFVWAAVNGMKIGTKHTIGSFYRGIYKKKDGSVHYFHDVLAYSMPYGMFAPVEFYDIKSFHKSRPDRHYFQNLSDGTTKNGKYQFTNPSNIIEIHIGTASPEGTIVGLNRIYSTISEKLRSGEELTAFEQNYVGYDAIQFMPIEPVAEPTHTGDYFSSDNLHVDGRISIELIRPDITNWGYDINIHGSGAINGILLETGRPDELAELMNTLYTFPGGSIMPIWDLVFGHATNQGLDVLPPSYFTGPNMYGQDMNFRHPVVRAILLEMQRRKTNWGATGLRIDGAQDFKYWDPEERALFHDDDYLQEMSDVVAHAGGVDYYPWMIFEDGRPWPRDDWELASSYRSVIQYQPDIWQWGPLTFAHNTPFIYTFWLNKFWRVREIMEIGSHWISGCSNHDTLRRGAQVNPKDKVNSKLGQNLRDIIQHAYNNEAQQLFFYFMAPGIPMDFLNANMQSPWLYFRNNDDYYGVKVVSEEYRFLDWWVTPDIYEENDKFIRLKKWGFDSYDKLYQFMNDLVDVVNVTDYNLERMAELLKSIHTYLRTTIFSEEGLKQFGWDFMDDMYELIKVNQYFDDQDETQNKFNREIREFRREHSWLLEDLDYERGEYFDYIHPSQSRAIYYGRRISPFRSNDRFELIFVANMEGTPYHFKPLDLPIPNLSEEGWQLLIKAPSVYFEDVSHQMTLRNSEGIVLIRYL